MLMRAPTIARMLESPVKAWWDDDALRSSASVREDEASAVRGIWRHSPSTLSRLAVPSPGARQGQPRSALTRLRVRQVDAVVGGVVRRHEHAQHAAIPLAQHAGTCSTGVLSPRWGTSHTAPTFVDLRVPEDWAPRLSSRRRRRRWGAASGSSRPSRLIRGSSTKSRRRISRSRTWQ